MRAPESSAAAAQEQGACIQGREGLRITQMDLPEAAATCAGMGPLFDARRDREDVLFERLLRGS